ncbi:hypothetical protein HBI56_169320 [Parastagonospora nodorum]|nr:hypothetical protein HBH53_184740 [Parastagonospora nodorum]KAH3997467.1 hypothetical protein HBI10_143960 [Parastagonospora nodorum]KAH4021152.1 hypothetical protein HBI13_112260 [Parastagonospora nodorum]KAH4037064.1 hypothetical protein HBI09_065410 [Parastagonospora nodorum]KAH4107689.1 hypothetical protein HBH46_054980 [Parastagonospora nodorum]
MSDLHHTIPLAPPPSLVLHTAVDFVHKQGIGIGVVQRAPIGAARNNIIPITKRKYSVKGSQFTSENVKTPKRAYMFAIILAMGLARGTIKRRCTKTLKIRKVTVLCESSAVVELVNFHRDKAPESLDCVISTNDCAMIKRVLVGVRELSRRGVDVVIAEDGLEIGSKETMRAETMARQKGRKACRSRCQAQHNAFIEAITDVN